MNDGFAPLGVSEPKAQRIANPQAAVVHSSNATPPLPAYREREPDVSWARRAYLAASFRLLRGRTLITFRAGLALNICSCFVKGLIPFRALVAGL